MELERGAAHRKVRLPKRYITRAQCPQCNELKQVLHQNERGEFYLACKHTRTTGLLDIPNGRISLEHILANDPLAIKLFPPDYGGYRHKKDLSDVIADIHPDELEAQARREKWSYERS